MTVPIRVKICCIASVEEAQLAVRAGAAVGLVSAMNLKSRIFGVTLQNRTASLCCARKRHAAERDVQLSSPEDRVPVKHPLRPIRGMVDEALKALSPIFDHLYADFGRPSIAPEKLLRALLLQVLYTIRSEEMLMEQLQYNLLFRWFVG